MNILLLDDSPFNVDLICRTLRRAGMTFEARRAEDARSMRTALETIPDFILCNDLLADIEGLAALEIAQEVCPYVPFLMVSAGLGEIEASEYIRRGACDCVPLSQLSRLPAAIRQAEALAQRQASQRELAAREHLLARIVDQAGVSIISTDLNGTVQTWNEAAYVLYGFSAEEALGRSLKDLQLSHLSAAEFAEVLARIRAGKRYSVESVNRTRDGRLIRVLSTHSPLQNDEHHVIGHVSIGRPGALLELEGPLRPTGIAEFYPEKVSAASH